MRGEIMGIAEQAAQMLDAAAPQSWDGYRWRVGREAYMEIAEVAAGPPGNHDALDDLGPRFRRIAEDQDRRREERLAAYHEGWGNEGSTLFGYPMLCDETFEGLVFESV